MAAQPTFVQRLWMVVRPTRVQSLTSVTIALIVLLLSQTGSIFHRLGITQAGLNASSMQFHDRFDGILRSSVAGQMALVTFWALVGLGAYLVCWAAYNLMIDLRNEVTIEALYTNRGPMHGPGVAILIKVIAAIGLGLMITSLWYGISFWIAVGSAAAPMTSVADVLDAVGAVVGFAVQLYALLVFVQLTFTPWYRAQTFTDS